MSELDTAGADRMRQADKVIAAVQKKLEQHRSVLGTCRHGVVKWRIDAKGLLEVEFQPTLQTESDSYARSGAEAPGEPGKGSQGALFRWTRWWISRAHLWLYVMTVIRRMPALAGIAYTSCSSGRGDGK